MKINDLKMSRLSDRPKSTGELNLHTQFAIEEKLTRSKVHCKLCGTCTCCKAQREYSSVSLKHLNLLKLGEVESVTS